MLRKTPGRSDKMLVMIGGFKLVKGLLLLALALGFFKLLGDDIDAELRGWVKQLKVDENGAIVRWLTSRLTGISQGRLAWYGIGTFFYAGLFLTEGVGLMCRKIWAEWLTVIATGSFIPLEIYELVKKATWLRGGLLVANIGILIYLIWQLKINHRKSVGTK